MTFSSLLCDVKTLQKWQLLFNHRRTTEGNSRSGRFFDICPRTCLSEYTISFKKLMAYFTNNPKWDHYNTSFSSSLRGLPTNATILVLWFLLCLCFKARWATRKPLMNFNSPLGWIKLSLDNNFPESVVNVTWTWMLRIQKRLMIRKTSRALTNYKLEMAWASTFAARPAQS